MGQAADVTALLTAWSNGDAGARGAALEAVYAELRRLARGHLRRERADHSLPPTALVHEAYLRLIDQTRVHWRNRAHFFAIAARSMRRILVDHARTRAAAKRGGGCTVPLIDDDVAAEAPAAPLDVLALDRALTRLAAVDARQARLVELRFFGGLTVEETAASLGVAAITVKRDWALARAWLYRELERGGAPSLAEAASAPAHEHRTAHARGAEWPRVAMSRDARGSEPSRTSDALRSRCHPAPFLRSERPALRPVARAASATSVAAVASVASVTLVAPSSTPAASHGVDEGESRRADGARESRAISGGQGGAR